ncbi:hypothetical protein CEY16_00765 [Halalkalibacillus sediminis]|uniref:Intracellular proteinase inhibitor BsuPI domain-containing protein n=1 Tax=Halalkalibacillus sediminis TaxID=2018042 RepID=A0A2I0QVE9_9BACI|nr:BsuPI-related putative proteinase inhibitor [Halalkalibacillus sediminis]PKR78323.1 hypothetical protein CEY16_00765 [Halalkalibacillus sediminis]
MKKILFILFTLLLVAACGTSESEEVSEGNEGTGDVVEDEKDKEQEQKEEDGADMEEWVNQLDFKASVDAEKEKATFSMNLANNEEEDLEMTFSSGQQFEIVVIDPETNEEIYRFSDGRMFTEALETKTIEADGELTWESDWDYTSDGERVEAKTYDVQVEILPMSINQKNIEEGIFKAELELQIPEMKEGSSAGTSSLAGSEGNEGEETDEHPSSDMFRNINVQGETGNYTVTGEARVFEGVFHYTVEDGHYVLVEEQMVQTDGAPDWGPFELDVEISEENLPEFGVLTMIMYWYDAKDGEPSDHLFITLEDFNP